MLIDPVWSERASPVRSRARSASIRRASTSTTCPPSTPCSSPTITTTTWTWTRSARLWQRFRPRIVTPLGNDAILKKSVPGLVATAVDWGDESISGRSRRCTWSRRCTGRRAAPATACTRCGRASSSAPARGRSIASATAVSATAPRSRRVGKRHPRLALALLPIGAYEPRWFMRHIHMNPEEAVEALRLSGAARALGHHWGTFRLTNEAIEQPPHDLATARTSRGIPGDRFSALRPGEVQMIG